MLITAASDGTRIVRGSGAEQALKKPDVTPRRRAADGLTELLADALHDRHPHGTFLEPHHA
ncbi:MAG: hypothetical protein P8R54_07295 [Myxococcota bacterium]|nr:hypothetical protein [Myxococcota bacterium]